MSGSLTPRRYRLAAVALLLLALLPALALAARSGAAQPIAYPTFAD